MSFYGLLRLNDLSLADGVILVSDWLTASSLGPLFFILLYVVGPLLFFPATLLSLLAGFLFGPWGIPFVVIGSNASALVAYSIGKYYGRGLIPEQGDGLVQRYAERLRRHSFQTVLIMHLVFLPYELVNYSCGILQIGWKPFLAGTALGSIVATISIVMLGASFGTIEELLAGEARPNPVTLAASVLLISISIGLSRYLRKREIQRSSAA
ncbi:MAG: VTT domain-containing protein [Anaerolineae bacterium]